MHNCAIVQFDFSNRELLEFARNLLELKFNFKCSIENLSSISQSEIFDRSRNQYYSTKILEHAFKNFSRDYEKIIVITQLDLFVPVLTFVFGEAQLSGKAAIVSTSRLHNEFYGLEKDEMKLLQRFKKELLHELGHTFGLKHCRDWFCVMHSSSTVDEVDIKGEDYCHACASLR